MRLLTERRLYLFIAVAAVYVFYGLAFASTGAEGGDSGGGHGGPVLDILLQLMVILLAAKLGGDFFERFHQPAVLGELIIGVLIGNLHLLGLDVFEPFKHNITLEILAEIGVIILFAQTPYAQECGRTQQLRVIPG